MKKVSYFLGAALLLAASYSFVSCGDKEDADDASFEAKMTPTGGETKIGFTQTFDYDAEVSLEITWKVPGKIDNLTLSIDYPDGSNKVPTGFPKKSDFKTDTEHTWVSPEKFTCPTSMQSTGCTYVLTAGVTDKNSGEAGARTGSQKITIKFNPKGGGGDTDSPINTVTSVELESITTAGVFGACTVTGTRYKLADAGATASDFVYFQGSQNGQTIASPQNITTQSTLSERTKVQAWSNIKKTKLAKLTGVSAADFDGMTNDKLIKEKVSVTTEIANQLAAGDIVGFITDDGKKGMIKVISAGSNKINFSIKVQQ